MKRFPHIAGVLLAVAAVVGLTFALNNDYYLRILFMMGVYYLCAAGMNVLRLAPPLIITESEADQALAMLDRACLRMTPSAARAAAK